jgi:hypothetical protein
LKLYNAQQRIREQKKQRTAPRIVVMVAAAIIYNHGGGVHAVPCSQQNINYYLEHLKRMLEKNGQAGSETSAVGSHHDAENFATNQTSSSLATRRLYLNFAHQAQSLKQGPGKQITQSCIPPNLLFALLKVQSLKQQGCIDGAYPIKSPCD